MSTPIQALQNNQGPPPPAQEQKKVTFQQPPPNVMKNAPHRQPKQETALPHPDIGNMPMPQQKPVVKLPKKDSETSKGLKIPPSQENKEEPSNLVDDMKIAGLVVLLSCILFSTPIQDCLMSVLPNGKFEDRPTMITLLVTSLVLGGGVFLSNKFLL